MVEMQHKAEQYNSGLEGARTVGFPVIWLRTLVGNGEQRDTWVNQLFYHDFNKMLQG